MRYSPSVPGVRTKPPRFAYARPQSTAAVLALLAAHGGDAQLLAGGQSLVAAMNLRQVCPAVLIDINRVPELTGVRPSGDGGLVIGAMTRQAELITDPLVAALPGARPGSRAGGHAPGAQPRHPRRQPRPGPAHVDAIIALSPAQRAALLRRGLPLHMRSFSSPPPVIAHELVQLYAASGTLHELAALVAHAQQ